MIEINKNEFNPEIELYFVSKKGIYLNWFMYPYTDLKYYGNWLK